MEASCFVLLLLFVWVVVFFFGGGDCSLVQNKVLPGLSVCWKSTWKHEILKHTDTILIQ